MLYYLMFLSIVNTAEKYFGFYYIEYNLYFRKKKKKLLKYANLERIHQTRMLLTILLVLLFKGWIIWITV